MKKKSQHFAQSCNFYNLMAALIFLVLSGFSHASSEVDRQFSLETVGALRTFDNVDGLFADYVTAAYKEFFATQSRFRYQDLSRADSLFTKSKIAYSKLIDDLEVLGKLSRAMQIESLIRTRVTKEGSSYRFVLDWLHSPHMEMMATVSFTLSEPKDGKSLSIPELKSEIQKALSAMIKNVPFVAHITGRDDQSVTVNLGVGSGVGFNVKKGDILEVATLDEVKKHPLLHTIVDWRFSPVGKLKVEEVEEGIAFCKIFEEEPGHKISRYQKITQIDSGKAVGIPITAEDKPEPVQKTATLGWANGGLWLGSFSRQYSSQDGSIGKGGGGFFTGVKADGQLWLTRSWFSELGFGYGFSGYTQSDLATKTATPAASVSHSAMQWRIDGGYNYYMGNEIFGPKAWAKLGYRSMSYTLPSSAAEVTVPVGFKGLFLGLGGDLPLRERYGARMSLDIGLMTSAKESGDLALGINSATDVSFFAGAYYLWDPKMTLTLGLDVTANSADYTDGSTLLHKIVSFGPTLVYYF